MAKNQKLVVEVVDARNLLPKDGHGTSSPYVTILTMGLALVGRPRAFTTRTNK